MSHRLAQFRGVHRPGSEVDRAQRLDQPPDLERGVARHDDEREVGRQAAQHLQGDEVVVRGDPAARKFAVFHLRDGAVAAVEAVNAAPEYLVGRKLIADGARVAPDKLADTSIAMKNIV